MVGSKSVGVRYLPEGYIFDASNSFISIKEGINKFYILGILASDLIDFLIKTFNPTINVTQDDIHRIPIVYDNKIEEDFSKLIEEIVNLKKQLLSYKDKSKLFNIDLYTNHFKNKSLQQIVYEKFKIMNELHRKINISNEIVFELYNISRKSRDAIYNELNNRRKIRYTNPPKSETEWRKNYLNKESAVDPLTYSEYVLQYQTIPESYLKEQIIILFNIYFGFIFNRWPSKVAKRNDGIVLINDSLLEDYLYDCIELTIGEEHLEKFLEEDIPRVLKKDLLSWIVEDYFKEHSSYYENRPIYWHVCSPNKTFNALIYYHALTSDTLYKLKSNYLKPMLENIREDLSFYREKMKTAGDKKQAKQFEKRVIELEKQVDDLEAFDKQIDDIIASGYEPDIDQGVLYNIKPLNPILAKKIEK
ncbi:hypothetical protein IC801_15135 [Geobacillus sp. 44B]|nr:hypothetical protein IC801_15135 [Geobacillus sp. 44B]